MSRSKPFLAGLALAAFVPLAGSAAVNAAPDVHPVMVIHSEFDNQTWAPDIDGWARVFTPSERDAGFTLMVRVAGLTPHEHAWHIHSGMCDGESLDGDEGLPVVVAITDEMGKPILGNPLVGSSDGMAQATVTVPVHLLTLDRLMTGTYSVHVHAPAVKGVEQPTMACANLR